MKIRLLDKNTSIQFQVALQEFEAQFHYPLGENKSFSISHGEDYSAFYRSMGVPYCLIAEEQNKVIGTFCCALRQIHMRDTNQDKTIVYLGDLKVSKQKQRTTVYYRLAEVMFKMIHEKTDTAIAMVMDGTRKTPDQYTGKLGLPQFHKLNRHVILRINTDTNDIDFPVTSVDCDVGSGIYRSMCNENYLQFSTENIRSNINPIWIVSRDKNACGKLEDTEKVKRLFSDDGSELRSAHLSHFVFANIHAAYELLAAALHTSKLNGFPCLFLCLTEQEYNQLLPVINSFKYDMATATLYSNQDYLNSGLHFNTAEI
ncbi:MAG: hypothetical protein A3E82_03345 [Gammaproteobacteria bacterium RIFCSPHIGHO2_12_FULL_38_11]|nr:MAG: hypothetical protein A3E82_03345 [Gammaproteobacteria bacterium RIFCSPHIGHO2_12_FULL_38_11]